MFRSVVFLLVVAACAAVPPSTAAPDRASAEKEIARVLDELHAAAAAADEARYFDQLAEDSIFLGTDATERWDKRSFRAYAHPHFQKGKAWSFRAVRRSVRLSESDTLAWFDEDLATQNLGPARGSGVLALRDGRWKILQYNLALTIPNERFLLVKEAAGAATVRSAPSGDPLVEIAWLSGAWVGKQPNGNVIEEYWTSADGGSLIGSGRTLAAGKTAFFEHLRIEARTDKIVYSAQPLGRPATEFERRSSAAGTAVFENPTHDWPKRIAYQRTPQGLQVRVSGDAGQRVDEWTLLPALVERVQRD